MSTKRKRGRSLKPSHLPPDVINPHSHAPDTLKQFVPAGLSSDLPLPAKLHPLFPHRPLRSPGHRRRKSRSRSKSKSAVSVSAGARTSDASETTDFDDAAVGGDDAGVDEFITDREGGGNTSTSDTEAGGGRTREWEREFGSRNRTARLYRQRVGAVAAICQRLLAEGDIAGAKRAFGLLHRGMVAGKRVDLRHARFWELGTEVLIREGEDPSGEEERREYDGNGKGVETAGGRRDKVGTEGYRRSRANLKGYFEHLIQQHPFSKGRPDSVSAVDFYPALFACQMEGIYAEHTSAMEALQEAFNEQGHEGDSHNHGQYHDHGMDGYMHDHGLLGDDGMDMDIDMSQRHFPSQASRNDDHEHTPEGHLLKLQREKDLLRQEALGQMRALAEKMDSAMEAPPFSKDHEMLKLRGMMALYIADLCVPLTPETEQEELDGQRARSAARRKARRVFHQVKRNGGQLEGQWIDGLLSEEDDEDEEEEEDRSGDERGLDMFSSLPMYSSIPIP